MIQRLFCEWSTKLLRDHLEAGIAPTDAKLDVSLSALKPYSLDWLQQAWGHLSEMGPAIIKGYEKVGTLQVIYVLILM